MVLRTPSSSLRLTSARSPMAIVRVSEARVLLDRLENGSAGLAENLPHRASVHGQVRGHRKRLGLPSVDVSEAVLAGQLAGSEDLSRAAHQRGIGQQMRHTPTYIFG